MSTYVVASYRVVHPEGFAPYPERSIPTVLQHGGEILAADFASEVLEGTAAPTTIVLRFPDREAATAWYRSAEYQEIAPLRQENCEGSIVFADEFVMPDPAAPKPWKQLTAPEH